jgi:hypothetical protein
LRILFDKNVPYPLRRHLGHHEVRTAAEEGLARFENGELLRAAEARGFELMVTADQSLEYQQNLKERKVALVVLSTNHISVLEQHPEKLVLAVDAAHDNSFERVVYPLPVRPKRKPDGS